MQARIRWDLLETEWSHVFNRPTRHNQHVDAIIPPPIHWHFNERMIHDLGGSIAVQATLVVVELRG